MKRIYADHAATTAVSERVLKAMLPYFRENYGNPSSIYSLAHDTAGAVKRAREQVAQVLHASPSEILFTSGGSEADNWAIRGAALLGAKQGKRHLITSKFEHHAVLHPMQRLEKEGFEVTYLEVHEDGLVRVEEVAAALRPDTALVSIMTANNEIGSIQPVAQIGSLCRERGILFHTDAVQAVGHIPLDVQEMSIDLLSLSAHKFYGPKGVGALYCKRGLRLPNLIDGGGQENGRRAGTENVPGIVGLGEAVTEAAADMQQEAARLSALRDRLIAGALTIARSRLNGDAVNRLPGNVSLCFEGVEGESLLLYLDLQGVCASSGSACTSGSLDPSHVLLSLGLPHEIAHGSLRLSLGRENTEQDVDRILELLPGIVQTLRDMSPLWERIQKEQANSDC